MKQKCSGTDLGVPCDRDSYAKGMCLMHYKRVWRHGDVETVKRAANGSDLEYKIRLKGWDATEAGCWEVRGFRDAGGYCHVSHEGKILVASRVAYELWVGAIPEGMVIRHTCDNPPCINPDHLIPGTKKDNADDMVSRGRQSRLRGESNPFSTLTEDQARAIKMDQESSLRTLAERYGVTISTISKIRRGHNWFWIE